MKRRKSETKLVRPPKPSRRRLLIGAGAFAVAGPLILVPGKAKAAERVVWPGYGGAYQDALQATIAGPFTKETGIPVVWAPAPDLAKVKAQITSGNVEWDIFDATSSWIPTGSKEGFWEPLDRSIVDTSGLIVPVGEDHAVLFMVASGISWDPKRYPAGKHPVNFRQLWDAKAFPGRRAFRDRIDFVLEQALVADGVSPKALYPLDIDRGFRALDRIKPLVKNWASATTQLTTLVQTGEVDFAWNWANRVKAAREANISLDFSKAQTVISREYMAVLKGSPNRTAAMKLLAFALRPDRSAALAERAGFIPTSQKAVQILTPEAKRWAPDLSDPNSVLQDDSWWVGKLEGLQQRFRQWLLT